MRKLTAKELADRLGISRRTIFSLRKQYPKIAPKTFNNVAKWRSFALGVLTNPDACIRLDQAR